MDDRRSADALTDAALDRDLEAALDVDPSPEFVARVRTRLQSEGAAPWSPWLWGLAAAGAAVVVIAAIVGVSRPDRSQVAWQVSPARQEQPMESLPIAESVSRTQDGPAAQEVRPAPRHAGATSRRRTASVNEPEVLIAAGEARALRRLFADVRAGRLDLSSLPDPGPAMADLQPPSAIAFAPIVFEPLATATAEESEQGERP